MIKHLFLQGVGKPYIIHKVFLDKLLFLPVKQIAPTQNLNLPEPNHDLFNYVDFGFNAVEALAGVCVLPLL